jgi:SAM-dependent methyltransferase
MRNAAEVTTSVYNDLICPDCRKPLRPGERGVVCEGCSRDFPFLFDGVLSLVPSHQEELKTEIMGWWSANNMDLEWRRAHPEFEKGSWEYFRESDRRWFNWHRPFFHTTYPLLHKVLDCRPLKGRKVLDLGCGLGAMFEQLCAFGADVTGLDLAPKHVYLTNARARLFGLNGRVLHGDAEALPLESGTFDFVYSFGVIHHSPNTRRSFEEIHRVLKPGGRFFVMVYNRHSYHYWNKMIKWGVFRGYFLKMNRAQLANRTSDGVLKGGNPLSQHFSPKELLDMTRQFSDVRVTLHGPENTVRSFPIKRFPIGKLFIPMRAASWIMSRYGHLAIVTGMKP